MLKLRKMNLTKEGSQMLIVLSRTLVAGRKFGVQGKFACKEFVVTKFFLRQVPLI